MLEGIVTSSQSHSCELRDEWIELQHSACVGTQCTWRTDFVSPPVPSEHLGLLSIWDASHRGPANQPTPTTPPISINHSLHVYLQTRSITASKFAQSWPPGASPNSLDYDLWVYLWVYSIVIFRHTSNCSPASPAASLDISCVDG